MRIISGTKVLQLVVLIYSFLAGRYTRPLPRRDFWSWYLWSVAWNKIGYAALAVLVLKYQNLGTKISNL